MDIRRSGSRLLGRALRASRTGAFRANEAFEFAVERLIESLEARLRTIESDATG